MDRKRDWSWLPAQMPGVARIVADKRRLLGNAHVNECWRRGVEQGEAGWFFAREGPLAVGVPDTSDPVMRDWCAAQVTGSQAIVMLRDPAAGQQGASNGS